MNSPLASARCFKHLSREAVARCPECSKFYCRECVTEHEGRMMCRSCLDALLQEDEKTKREGAFIVSPDKKLIIDRVLAFLLCIIPKGDSK